MSTATNLTSGGWFAPNRLALAQWLAAIAATPASDAAPVVAVFDWDNTCIFGDVGDAALRFDLAQPVWRWSLEQFRKILAALGCAHSALLHDGTTVAQCCEELVEMYALYEQLMRRQPHPRDAPEAAAAPLSPACGRLHANLAAKLGWLYNAVEQTPPLGARVAYPWQAALLACGRTPAAVRHLASAAVRDALAEPIARQQWTSPDAGRVGCRSFAYTSGLRPHAEISELMTAMQREGVEVFIVSACLQPVLEAAVALLQFPVPPTHIFGMRCHEAADGTFSAQVLDSAAYPITYRQGKVQLIAAQLPAPPQFVAGDADTDYEMLTHFAETRLRLVINRRARGAIHALYALARTAAKSAPVGPPHQPLYNSGVLTLLQGRDETRGCFWPRQKTRSLQPLAGGRAA